MLTKLAAQKQLLFIICKLSQMPIHAFADMSIIGKVGDIASTIEKSCLFNITWYVRTMYTW